jgi:hypothetical protein
VRGLEPDLPGRRQLIPAARDEADQVLVGLSHLDELAQRLDPLQVAEVGQEHGPVGARQHGAVAAGVAGQVADVGQVGDQQRIDAETLEPGAEMVEPGGVAHAVCSER